VLEVERDGDLLQDEFAFYIALGLPVYVGQLRLAAATQTCLRWARAGGPSVCFAF
jgi:hypothetical protein